jgi:hypothetical protein
VEGIEAEGSGRRIEAEGIEAEARSFHGVHSGSPFPVDCWLSRPLEPAKAFPIQPEAEEEEEEEEEEDAFEAFEAASWSSSMIPSV